MWALRRASIHFKNCGLSLGGSRIFCIKSEISRCSLDNYDAGFIEPQELLFGGLLASTRFYNTSSSSLKLYMEGHTFSSQAGAESSGEEDDDLEDGFSELEAPVDAVKGATSGDENDDELISETDASEDEGAADDMQIELEALGTETDGGEKTSPKTRATSPMNKAILAASPISVSKALDKWVEEGNEVKRTEVTLTMLNLRKRKLFVKALKLSEWLESTKRLDFLERDYASRIDLIAKTRGIIEAKNYISKIPESFRGEVMYRTLLANCVSVTNVKKSEEVFNEMKNLEFPVTCFACNQLLLLYKRTDKKKIADVLLLMEKENIKPSLFTYQILIDVKGLSNDISGMEQIVETMKAEGVELNTQIQATLARHYAAGGIKDKAEAVLKEMEGGNREGNRWLCRSLLPIYASLGRDDEVERLWQVCKSNPWTEECLAAIDAWGKLKRVEDAEAVFEKMLEKVKKPSSRHFSALLKVYANHKMLAKGKDLVKRMTESGCTIMPSTLDSVIKLYVEAGEVEKADNILDKGVKRIKGQPMFTSFLAIMDQYSNRGDIHNAEKIFQKMRRAGYVSRLQPFHLLIKAYINAKAPAYGLAERMKADRVYPNKIVAAQLAQVDAFRKSALDELLG